MPKKKRINPFYILLVIVGIVFTITATAYGVMTFRASQPITDQTVGDIEHPLWVLVDKYGTWALLAELAVLGICTFAAIGLDQFWSSRDERESQG